MWVLDVDGFTFLSAQIIFQVHNSMFIILVKNISSQVQTELLMDIKKLF